MELDGQPQQDLALVTSRDKTSLSRLLATMEAKQLITNYQMDVKHILYVLKVVLLLMAVIRNYQSMMDVRLMSL